MLWRDTSLATSHSGLQLDSGGGEEHSDGPMPPAPGHLAITGVTNAGPFNQTAARVASGLRTARP